MNTSPSLPLHPPPPPFLQQSEVYGDGFRMALDAYQAHGLVKLLAHVKQTGAFPIEA